MIFDARAVLKESAGKDDSDLNLFTLALAFAAPSHEGISIDKYFSHGTKIANEIGERYIALLNAGAKRR